MGHRVLKHPALTYSFGGTIVMPPKQRSTGPQESFPFPDGQRMKPSGRCGVKQTHCRRGHEFTTENTIIRKNGQRLCRMCRNFNGLSWWRKLSKTEKSIRAARGRHMRKYDGFSLEEYAAMAKEQNGACAICGVVPEKLHVDHCHKTGKVRQLLCHKCNLGIGYFADSPEIMGKAIQYIKRHQIAE